MTDNVDTPPGPGPDRSWWELVCIVPAARQDEALACLSRIGLDEGWVETPLRHERTPDGWHPVPADPHRVRLHVCIEPRPDSSLEAEAARVRAALDELAEAVETGEVQAADWLEDWRRERRVVPLGEGWAITPPWLRPGLAETVQPVIIDPGLAFGAGDHPTTRDSATMLLAWLQPGDRVLDLGAGSGVLAILARLAGSGPVVAVELDALAVAEIPRNMALNEVEGITVIEGDATILGEELARQGPFDLIVMNIGAAPAKLLTKLCDSVATPATRLILSGLTEWAAGAVAEAYAASGWRVRRRLQAGSEWVTLGLTRLSAGGAGAGSGGWGRG